jgi:hypothetical protein
MEIKDQELFNIWEVLNETVNADIPSFVGSCRIAEVYENLKAELGQFFKFRESLYKEYFNLDAKGLVLGIKDATKLDEFNTKLNELMLRTRTIDINNYKIKLSYLKDIKLLLKNEKGAVADKISMPPMYRIVLKPFIENDIKE